MAVPDTQAMYNLQFLQVWVGQVIWQDTRIKRVYHAYDYATS